MNVPRGRAWPVAFLLLLAPLIAEVLWGTTTVSDSAGYLAQIGLYGGGAVLIREVSCRWGGGWPSILLLGAAYVSGLGSRTWPGGAGERARSRTSMSAATPASATRRASRQQTTR